MNVTEEIDRIRAEIQTRLERIEWLELNQSKLVDLPAASTHPGTFMDFDRLPHKEIVKVVRALGGKWKKTPGHIENTINYQTEIDGKVFRCWSGEPPPSCKIIEVEEHVPEQVIPASTRKVRKLVCQPDVAAVIQTAAERGAAL